MSEDRRVAIVGLGYVGLPLALSFVDAGLDVVGVDSSVRRVDDLRAGQSPIDDIDDARLQRQLAAGFRIVVPAEAALADADAIFVCVPTPITEAKDPDLGPVRQRRRGHRRAPPGRSADRAPVDHLPGHDDRPVPRRARALGPPCRAGLRPRLRAGTRQPGRSGERDEDRPAARRRDDSGRHDPGRDAAAPHQRQRDRAHVARCRRAREAPRERVPEREHRPRQPARPAVRADGRRRLGGDRRGGHEAVRVHALHARSGGRRPLHPGRSLLPLVAGPRIRLRGPLRRARRRHQPGHAAPRRRPRRRGPQRAGAGGPGRPGRHPRGGLQARCPRPAQLAGGRRHGPACASAGRTSRSTTRTSPRFRLGDGTECASTELATFSRRATSWSS